jgi:hypothetical protein
MQRALPDQQQAAQYNEAHEVRADHDRPRPPAVTQGQRCYQAWGSEPGPEIGENSADHAPNHATCPVKTAFAAPEIAETIATG